MTATQTSQAKTDIEKIFNEVIDAQEQVISQYRMIYMQHQDNVMADQLFAFLDEMEGLKRRIQDTSAKITDRIDNAGRIAEFISDLLSDEREEEQDSPNRILEAIDNIELTFGYTPESVGFEKENNAANAQQYAHIEYFKQKKAELDQMLVKYPELKSM